jgi:hypothetical protein
MAPFLAIIAAYRKTPPLRSPFPLAWRARRTNEAGAAIDDQRLAGDVAHLCRQQKADGVTDDSWSIANAGER